MELPVVSVLLFMAAVYAAIGFVMAGFTLTMFAPSHNRERYRPHVRLALVVVYMAYLSIVLLDVVTDPWVDALHGAWLALIYAIVIVGTALVYALSVKWFLRQIGGPYDWPGDWWAQ